VTCLALGGLLHLKEVYWGAISTVVVMQSEVGPTGTASRDRFVGTLVGALMGWLASLVWHGSVLVFGLAVLDQPDAVRCAGAEERRPASRGDNLPCGLGSGRGVEVADRAGSLHRGVIRDCRSGGDFGCGASLVENAALEGLIGRGGGRQGAGVTAERRVRMVAGSGVGIKVAE